MTSLRRVGLIALVAGACALPGACTSNGGTGGTTRTETSAPALPGAASAKVDRAVAVTRAIQARPESADEVLRQNGMTERQYEDLLYEIAADPAMSLAYNAKVGS